MKTPMTYSGDGLAVTEDFEKCRLVPYQDSKGVWTDGWGNTHGVVPHGPAITQGQADSDLVTNTQGAVDCVNHYVQVELTQHEFDALVDFVFNVGGHAFATSTLLRLLNSGNHAAAANEFEKWDVCGGQHLPGLLRRRHVERDEFLS